ncbi:MerR family transcriptional regulator [Deinococcus aquiradiocola]|uniref:HTH merR-type domain-containing protein n=1 Tax=Deinococcus aquiradiocola TaxID=393059 RepID=A0A917UQP1_9DEIO|nr:MerR family transcriptional regulator [Deinococcus aquiradiocola]GGJ76267.1 hypothetical protein GCM10008939_20620 [Deinococcus aquiradiocola]
MPDASLPGAWSGGLDDLAALANALLPRYLPLDRTSRTTEDVNPRLIRHYTTQGLLDPPQKEGREARYGRRHLLQLLTLRRLMGEGHSAQALLGMLPEQADDDLEALLNGTGRLQVQPGTSGNAALSYLAGLRQLSPDVPVSSAPLLMADEAAPMLSAPPPPVFSAAPEMPARRRQTSLLPTPAEDPDSAPLAERVTRFTLMPGVEILVTRSARLPRTRAEQEALAERFTRALGSLRTRGTPDR